MPSSKIFGQLQSQIRSKANAKGLLEIFVSPYETIDVSQVRLTEHKISHLVEEGILLKQNGLFYPGFLLNIATTDNWHIDFCRSLPVGLSDLLHRDILRYCIQISKSRTIPLLHAQYLTNYYFDCDRFIASACVARRIAAGCIRSLLSFLNIDFIACTISPEGLIGTYPLCFYLALETRLDVVATIRRRRGGIDFVGNMHPRRGNALILHDVLTTGTSILQLCELLRSYQTNVAAALVLYDRQEGGRDILEQNNIPIGSLMSIKSLRKHCDGIRLGKIPSYGLKRKANGFLAASQRLQFVNHTLRHPLSSHPIVAIAPHLAPPVEAFSDMLQIKPDVRKFQRQRIAKVLQDAVRRKCTMVIMPELTIPVDCQDLLTAATKQRPLIVVAGSEYNTLKSNLALIAVDGRIYEQPKLVRSPYDRVDMMAGDTVNIFKETYIGNFAVLVCADHVNYQVIDGLKGQVDLLVIVARNKAIKTFAAMAAGDAYRIYSFIIVVNDVGCGDSLIASPEKGSGKIKWMDTRNSEHPIYCELPVEKLRRRDESFLREIVYSSHIAEEKPK